MSFVLPSRGRWRWAFAIVWLVAMGGLLWAVEQVVWRPRVGSNFERARAQARVVRDAAELYLVRFPEAACPTAEQLSQAGILSPATSSRDPWGTELVIWCHHEEAHVVSRGPDHVLHTVDDVRP